MVIKEFTDIRNARRLCRSFFISENLARLELDAQNYFFKIFVHKKAYVNPSLP
jgi:hypothetical protein